MVLVSVYSARGATGGDRGVSVLWVWSQETCWRWWGIVVCACVLFRLSADVGKLLFTAHWTLQLISYF